jgi:hypothetical protein
MCDFILLSSQDLGEKGCERRIDMFPRSRVGVGEMACYSAIISSLSQSSELTHLLDHTSSSSIICCLAFFARRPSELPQK